MRDGRYGYRSLSARVLIPVSTRMVSRPASSPHSTSVSIRSPIIAVLSLCPPITFSAERIIIGFGLPTKYGSTPVAFEIIAATEPAAGSVAAMISKATGVEPYFVGKPNPMMMRSALNTIKGHSESTAMIGNRMDTDILCGLEAGLETILVLTGISTAADVERYPYRPSRIVPSVAELIDEI